MTESEAKLRIEQSFKHGSEIKVGLDQLRDLVQKRNPSQGSHNRRPNFVGPYDANLAKQRWNNCCISATKQLYGANQNVGVKHQTAAEQQQARHFHFEAHISNIIKMQYDAEESVAVS